MRTRQEHDARVDGLLALAVDQLIARAVVKLSQVRRFASAGCTRRPLPLVGELAGCEIFYCTDAVDPEQPLDQTGPLVERRNVDQNRLGRCPGARFANDLLLCLSLCIYRSLSSRSVPPIDSCSSSVWRTSSSSATGASRDHVRALIRSRDRVLEARRKVTEIGCCEGRVHAQGRGVRVLFVVHPGVFSLIVVHEHRALAISSGCSKCGK